MNTINKIKLSNLTKCNQNWTDMPENESGRICLKCNNTIIDFRNLEDSEIARTHFLSEGKICGLYKKEQLQETKPRNIRLKLTNWSSFYIGFISFLSFTSIAQVKNEPIKFEQTEKNYNLISTDSTIENKDDNTIKSDSIFISGILTDKNDEPLPFVNIVIKGTQVGVTSDFDGFYRINITQAIDTLSHLTLRYFNIGYETVEIEIDSNSIKEEQGRIIDVRFKDNEDAYFVTVKTPFHKKVWNGIKNAFRKKD